jgi:hypothetical protein
MNTEELKKKLIEKLDVLHTQIKELVMREADATDVKASIENRINRYDQIISDIDNLFRVEESIR